MHHERYYALPDWLDRLTGHSRRPPSPREVRRIERGRRRAARMAARREWVGAVFIALMNLAAFAGILLVASQMGARP